MKFLKFFTVMTLAIYALTALLDLHIDGWLGAVYGASTAAIAGAIAFWIVPPGRN